MADRSPRLAVLIDADNASAKITRGLFEEVAKIGDAVVRWIYGDFSSARSKAWEAVLVEHAIVPKQQFANTTGKNASDITLVIEAMDLLHTGLYDGFCLVSSDSDFTRLASRLREQGVAVYGFGEKKTPESFRQACTRFIYTENLVPASSPRVGRAGGVDNLAALESTVGKIVSETDSNDGWVLLGGIGKQLASLFPDFDPRSFGYKKLSDLIRDMKTLELVSDGTHPRVRLRAIEPVARLKTKKR